MLATKNLTSGDCWIIMILCGWWISYCGSSRIENLRWNRDEKKCMSELVSSGLLTDEQFKASSYFEKKTIFQARMSRLLDMNSQSSTSDGRAWCPGSPVHKDLTEWLEVDFHRMTFLRVIYTVGRGDGNFKEFTPQIVIRYQRSDSGPWFTYHDAQNQSVLTTNTDSRTIIRISLQTIVAKRIRIFPLDILTGPKFVCLKVAFLGCYFNDEIVSYTAPQGDQGLVNNNLIDLRDQRYDGTRSGDLRHGLGILTNNIVYIDEAGADDFVSRDMSGIFTGWRCTKDRINRTVNITFYYEQERVFSQISIFYGRKESDNILLTGPITIYIGYDNITHQFTSNHTIEDLTSVLVHESLITIPLNEARGSRVTLSITCGNGNWIVLSEVEIVSKKLSGNSNAGDAKLVTLPYHSSNTDKEKIRTSANLNIYETRKDLTLSIVIGLAIILLLVLFICASFLCYRMRKLRHDKLNKKLELVAKGGEPTITDPSGRTVFTMPSKQASISSINRSRQPGYNTYNGSQLSDGVYASWPNTDEETDVPNIDREEEKCLLGMEGADNRSSGKEYAVYQPGGVGFSGSDYYHSSRPTSTFVPGSNHSTLSEKMPLSVSNLKIMSSSYDLPMTTPTVTYRNNTNSISYQHLIYYRGMCGDVDLRYEASRLDHQHCHQAGLDPTVKILSTSSIILVQPWVRGQFGCIDLVTVALTNNDTGRYFIRKLNYDSPPAIRSKFCLDLQILSTLTSSTVSRLAAIVLDSNLPQDNVADLIRSARFSVLIDHNGGYNLKDFLRNSYYPSQAQNYKTATLSAHSQISISSMLLIITQMSAALRHLEELGLAHRDVGCRNCIIDSKRQVTLYPGGYVTTQPYEDYCSIELQNHLINFPLRWLAPESISKGTFTCKSDVWSFGVAMWEVFTLCSLLPYPSLTNEALLELISDRNNCPRLPCPQNCPREMYGLMTQCWSWDESLRPTFVDVNMFLQIKTTASSHQAQLILPAPPPITEAHQLSM